MSEYQDRIREASILEKSVLDATANANKAWDVARDAVAQRLTSLGKLKGLQWVLHPNVRGEAFAVAKESHNKVSFFVDVWESLEQLPDARVRMPGEHASVVVGAQMQAGQRSIVLGAPNLSDMRQFVAAFGLKHFELEGPSGLKLATLRAELQLLEMWEQELLRK